MLKIEDTILEYISKEFLTEEDLEITYNTPLISSGIVDSFAMVSLKRFLENRYNISIPNEKATPEAFDSIQKIEALMQTLMKK
ncbi:MAG: acyl carrier protein [Candidatus Brocadiae bacterium]|nr:acyl carrier protein [Candidatus Brocadiia bacterium]